MAEIVCFGEVMLRLTTPHLSTLADAPSLDVTFGGAEANVAVQLAQFGRNAAFVSRLPENGLGDRCVADLRGRGVDTSGVLRGGARMGVYFLEPGVGQRPGKVTYDRQHAAITEMKPGMVNWDAVLDGAKWFHWSGITPALGAGCAALCEEACMTAKKRGITVSFDVNYRAKLWSREAAATALRPLMRHADVCVAGESEAVEILGVAQQAGDEDDRLRTTARALSELHGFRTVAMSCRAGDSATHTTFRAMIRSGETSAFSRRHEITVVDRVGTGDSFTGGLIHALLRGDEPAHAIEFAAATAAWKHTIHGDWNRGSVAEIEGLAGGSGGGRLGR
ncbi:MAG: sugar kinase [Chthoniobacteraceae bacterium]